MLKNISYKSQQKNGSFQKCCYNQEMNLSQIEYKSARLKMRPTCLDDASFILDLFNDKEVLYFIGDRNLRTLEDARKYIQTRIIDGYANHGFNMMIVEFHNSPVGICGVFKHPALEEVQLGYAFLPSARNQGFALESALASLQYAKNQLGLKRIEASATTDNLFSLRVLEKCGMHFVKLVPDPFKAEQQLKLYRIDF